MERLALFASGTGSNVQKIMDYFRGHPNIQVRLVVSNKAKAAVLEKADAAGVERMLLNRQAFYESEQLVEELQNRGITCIVLAGFLWLVPPYLIKAYPHRILNLHPALLPKFGGKGMYGKHVHQAVKEAGATESGITIHEVNEAYDEGKIIFQQPCPVLPTDSPQDIARKVQQLEHRHFAPVIERFLTE